MTRTVFIRVVALGGALASACAEPARTRPLADSVAAPAPGDRGDRCADVGAVRACWGADLSGAACSGGVCLVERNEPGRAAGGWRCSGAGAGRTCEPRSRTRSPFSCDGDRCAQRHPRAPDDGEWECADLAGVVVCHGGTAAAGVVPGRADRGWTCGQRRGAPQERVCVDAAPDLPDAGAWRCEWDRRYLVQRVCTRADVERSAGARCANAGECVAGMACAGGRCLPARLEPACWLDGDCAEGARCRFGSCSEAGR